MDAEGLRITVDAAVPLEAVAAIEGECPIDRNHIGLAKERIAVIDRLEVAAPRAMVLAIGIVLAHPAVESTGEVVHASHRMGQGNTVAAAREGG